METRMTDQPHPALSGIPYWLDDSAGAYHLFASKETSSGKHFFPPIPSSSPLAERYRRVRLSAQATLYSYTIIHPNPKSGKAPFALVYADFPEEVRVFGQMELAPDSRPRIGEMLKIEYTSDATGAIRYFFKQAA
jgi:hypothetical protein